MREYVEDLFKISQIPPCNDLKRYPFVIRQHRSLFLERLSIDNDLIHASPIMNFVLSTGSGNNQTGLTYQFLHTLLKVG